MHVLLAVQFMKQVAQLAVKQNALPVTMQLVII